MQAAQDPCMEEQLVIAPKAVHKTADGEDISNDDFEESDSESKQELMAMPGETAICKKKSKKNVKCSQFMQLHKGMSCQVPDRLGAIVSPSCYCSPHTNTVFVGAAANKAASYEYKTEKTAKWPKTIMYKCNEKIPPQSC
ncbi:hypothetical protein C0995_015312 [Termitomyces sp. Mi166|nr:hypothetical protein C0995_015312 [Termitomyces sp. Mi166\